MLMQAAPTPPVQRTGPATQPWRTDRDTPIADVRGGGRPFPARSHLVHEGEAAPACRLISGWAGLVRVLLDGRRQILQLVLPGDLLSFCSMPGTVSTCSVVALTPVIVSPPMVVGPDQAARRTAAAMNSLQNQICRLGRQNAYERLASLLVEMHERLRAANECSGDAFEMPLTQETLADVLGLTSVHVNRTIQQMRRDGLIRMEGRTVVLADRAALTRAAEYRRLPI